MRYKDRLSDSKIEVRMTADEKEKIKATAAEMNLSISEFIRYACKQIIEKED